MKLDKESIVTDYSYLDNSRLFVGKVIRIDLSSTKIINFTCPSLDTTMELRALPLGVFNEVKPGDDVLIIQPEARFSDTLFYIPVSLNSFYGLKRGHNCVNLTNPDYLIIEANKGIILNAGGNAIVISSSGNTQLNGNLTVSGKLGSESGEDISINVTDMSMSFNKGSLASSN